MTVKNPEYVKAYKTQRQEALNMIDNLREFLASTPEAEKSSVPNVDYFYMDCMVRMHDCLLMASSVANSMSN